MKINESGRTMLEVLMVMGIAGMLAVSVYAMVGKVMDKYKLSKIGTQIQSVRKGVYDRYSVVGNYKEIKKGKVDNLIETGAIPRDVISGNKLRHAFGGEIDIDGDGDRFSITFNEIPKKACIELALLDWKVDDTSLLHSIKIGGSDFYWEPVTVADRSKALPITVAKAHDPAICKDRNNVITWVFY